MTSDIFTVKFVDCQFDKSVSLELKKKSSWKEKLNFDRMHYHYVIMILVQNNMNLKILQINCRMHLLIQR